MRRLARDYSIHLPSPAALIRRNDDFWIFGIGTRGKAYRFCLFIRAVSTFYMNLAEGPDTLAHLY
jgi:hypothetical protein